MLRCRRTASRTPDGRGGSCAGSPLRAGMRCRAGIRGGGRHRRVAVDRSGSTSAVFAVQSVIAERARDAMIHAARSFAASSAGTRPASVAAASACRVDVVRNPGTVAACCSCSSCTNHSTSDSEPAAELEVAGGIGTLRKPLGLDAGLDALHLPHIRRRDRFAGSATRQPAPRSRAAGPHHRRRPAPAAAPALPRSATSARSRRGTSRGNARSPRSCPRVAARCRGRAEAAGLR